ncbi:CcmA Integral membrane protein CcmA involved in cell shape determination [Methylophilaceae bacterium]
MEDKDGTLLIGKGVIIKGGIIATGAVHVYGEVNGEIAAKEITVGISGKVTGDVRVDVADIQGEVLNLLEVRQTLIVRSNGRISGTISYQSLEIEHGGFIEGHIEKLPLSKEFESLRIETVSANEEADG